MARYGIELSLSGTRVLLTGSLKEYSKDFEVRELDFETGQVAAFPQENIYFPKIVLEKKFVSEVKDHEALDSTGTSNKSSYRCPRRKRMCQEEEKETARKNKVVCLSQESRNHASVLKEGSTPLGLPSTSPLDRKDLIAPISETEELQFHAAASRDRHELTDGSACSFKAAKTTLNDLLSESEVDSLRNLAEGIKECQDDTVELQSKSIEDKNNRHKLHQAIRFLYPVLETDVSKEVGQVRKFIVKRSKVFQECSSCLSHTECEKLFRLIYAQDYFGRRDVALRKEPDKEKRRVIHSLISKHLGSFVESKTITRVQENPYDIPQESGPKQSNLEIVVRLRFIDTMNKKPKSNYIRFVMRKENCETLEAINYLSHSLLCPAKSLGYAGTKDKKAVTYQWITVAGVPLAKVRKVQEKLTGKVQICSPVSTDYPLRLGFLSGNWFNVRIRNVKVRSHDSREEICASSGPQPLISILRKTVNCINRGGFINYFGLQRFGFEENQVSTADIGKAMLQQDFRKVIDLLFLPSKRADSENVAKQIFSNTGDIKETLRKMPFHKRREILVLKGLKRHGLTEEGCKQSLMELPFPVRLMYVHSYASLIWNKAATYRLKQYGTNVVAGDFVMVASEGEGPSSYEVKALNEEEAKSGNFSLTDVVLPIPGHKSHYPSILLDFYTGLLAADSLTAQSFKIKGLLDNVPGSYRHLISIPSYLGWCVCLKDSASVIEGENLTTVCNLDVDAHRMEKTEDRSGTNLRLINVLSTSEYGESQSKTQSVEENFTTEPDGCDYMKLGYDFVLQFALPPSSYATMFLREFIE